MIYESYVYKDELLKIADRFEKRLVQKRWSEHSTFLLEKDVFFSFFTIRKLIEAKTKLSEETSEMKIDLKRFEPTGMKPNIRNHYDCEKLYNLEKYTKCKRDIYKVCSDVIHSYIIMFELPSSSLKGKTEVHSDEITLFFNSFNSREKGLYALLLTDHIKVLRVFGSDYPALSRFMYNEDIEDYEIFTSKENSIRFIDKGYKK